MGVISSQSTARPRGSRRTIWFTFAAMVAGPVACLVVVWGLLLAGVVGGAMGDPDRPGRDHRVVVDFVTVVGLGLLIIVAGVTLMGLFARRLARDITDLEATARRLADEEMPEFVERLRRGEQATVPAEFAVRPRTKTAEVAEAETAIASLQHSAAKAAADEASLRNGIRQVFVSLARRNQSLLQRQLRLIDMLEQKASDPATLADLFPLDHLTTRMRRHAEGLIILSGAAPGRSWSEPVPVIDVIRGAVAEVEDYKRVTVLTLAEDAVAGLAAADMIHLLAELIENATLSSPSGTRVEVRAERVANGFTIEIDDRGLGIEAGQLRTINQQLAEPPDFDLANADQLGLFVVGKLAARHGVRVALRPSPYGGTTAVVLMPNTIVVPMGGTEADTDPNIRLLADRTPGIDLRRADALILTGRQMARPLPGSAAGEPETTGSSPGAAPSPAAAVLGPIGTPLGSTDSPPGAAAGRAGSVWGPASSVWGPAATPGPAGTTPGSARTTPGSAGTTPGPGGTTPEPGGDGPSSTDPDVADTAVGRVGFSLGSPGPGFGSPPPHPGSPASGPGSPATSLGSPSPGAGPVAPSLGSPAPGPASAAPGLGSSAPSPGSSAPGSDAGDGPGPASAAQAAGTYRGLPRRVRQASLNPRLRDSQSAAARRPRADGTAPSEIRSPEEARNLVASLQSGWQRGRETDAPDTESTDAAQAPQRRDSEAT
jgi:signal transduction histidine kinase